jgi:hypothetical protein
VTLFAFDSISKQPLFGPVLLALYEVAYAHGLHRVVCQTEVSLQLFVLHPRRLGSRVPLEDKLLQLRKGALVNGLNVCLRREQFKLPLALAGEQVLLNLGPAGESFLCFY